MPSNGRQAGRVIMVCPHSPDILDLVPYDFWLFPKIKMIIKSECFESIQDTNSATTIQLKTLMREDPETDKSNRVSVHKAARSILRGTMAMSL